MYTDENSTLFKQPILKLLLWDNPLTKSCGLLWETKSLPPLIWLITGKITHLCPNVVHVWWFVFKELQRQSDMTFEEECFGGVDQRREHMQRIRESMKMKTLKTRTEAFKIQDKILGSKSQLTAL